MHLLAAAKDWIASRSLSSGARGPLARNDGCRETHIALGYRMCYKARMFPNRQTIASRVVLDDRSRLPWRFFGRLTTAALAA
jgi:hypothetical protein